MQPPGFVDPTQPHLVCKLHEALYGLKQAPRAWYCTFSSFLSSQGFVHSQCDTSLLVHKSGCFVTYFLIYVDDILLTRNNQSYIQSLLSHMHTAFSMKDLGDISYFLGISVQPTAQGSYFLYQQKCAAETLVKASMVDCKPCSTRVKQAILVSK